MKNVLYCEVLSALLLLTTAPLALADSTRARCDIYPAGSDHASASIACTFSQYQGNVYIDRSDGISHELLPTGDTAGNYVDQAGKPVYRQSGLGSEGLVFRMPNETVYVYWDASSLEQAAGGEDNPTAPYTTADYDATTLLPCSLGVPSHDDSCPAGIHRGMPGSGSATIHVTAPDDSERVLEFADGGVTTPGDGELTWGKQGDEWYIGIDNWEFYVVPEAAVYGG